MPRHKISTLSWFVLLFTGILAASSFQFFQSATPGVFSLRNIAYALVLLVLAQVVAQLVCYLIIRYEHVHAHLSHDAVDSGPQKFHALPTPRIGGIALMAGLVTASVTFGAFYDTANNHEFSLLILAALPAFFGGVTEDITKRVGVAQRLGLTMLSAAIGAWLLGGHLNRVDVPGMDMLMQWLPFGIAFTIFAVAGATNAINIIDGYNGLAGGFSIIVLLALAYVSGKVGDITLVTASLVMVGALLGFMAWNWPGGKIFLGDGGAYLVGFWISEISVLLLVRHPQVSVWFPLLVMAYPVFETLFSIYRRKVKRNAHPGHPDSMHLHQLIYKRLVRIGIGSKIPQVLLHRNSAVAPYVWTGSGAICVLACVFWQNAHVLAAITVAGCLLYVLFYRRMVKWRVPGFLVRRHMKTH